MKKHLDRYLILLSFLIIIITGLRNYYLPFNHDEAATFFHFVQKGDFLPYISKADANNHFLNSLFSYTSFKFFGSSPFALRLPNLLALILLVYALFRINRHLHNLLPQLVLFSCFLLSFHWLSFFNISRGYGLSMAFLIFGIAFFLDYLKNPKTKYLLFIFVLLQSAISANLTLVITILLLTILIWYYQLRNQLFNIKNIIISVLHLSGLIFWIKYSFYLKANNALYYGSGTSYFNSTFTSLVELITGYSSIILTVILLIISAILVTFNIGRKFKSLSDSSIFNDYAFTFSFISLVLVVGFYLLNKIAGINFPEDRTGLFFYVFIVLALVFTLDLNNKEVLNYAGYFILSITVVHFITQLNFSRHSVSMYATMPHSFYNLLVSEQENNKFKITIGGYRMSELSYNFMNYRNGGHLNPMDPYEKMQMQCDYQITKKNDFNYYKKFYEEIKYDNNHEFVLLKRKEEIERNLIYSTSEKIIHEGDHEYFNFYEATEVILENTNPLIAEIDFTVIDSQRPFSAWIVFYGEGPEGTFYERIPLNWMKFDWNGKSERIHLVTETMSGTYDKIIVYLWNLRKEPLYIEVNHTKIFQVSGEGVNVTVEK
jgi:hypothetical protein